MSSQRAGVVISATGDSMITRRMSANTKSQEIARIVKKTDVGSTNCEMLFHRYESHPMKPLRRATAMAAEPFLARELRSMGFGIVSLCNNHVCDYGPQGMYSTIAALEDAGIVHAGAGKDLDEAREPKYLETEKGRIALIASSWDPFQEGWERASKTKGGVPARPGINLLRVDTDYVVSRETFDALIKAASELGLRSPEPIRGDSATQEFDFLGYKFRCDNDLGIYRTIRNEDLRENILSIEDARKRADCVLFSFHCHTGKDIAREYPPDFLCQFARQCIDAGADAFIGHGPHILRGIEIYRRRPIFYSLGNFIVQPYTVRRVPDDQFELFGLGGTARPSDFFLARSPTWHPASESHLRSIVAVFELVEGQLADLTLHPITMGIGQRNIAEVGYPELAGGAEARGIIELLRRLSVDWNTDVICENSAWKVVL